MEETGYHKTGDQCSRKINKLKYEYRRIKDNNEQSGRGRKEWKFLDAMDSVLGHKPATRPPVVVESGAPPTSPEQSPPSLSSLSTSVNDSKLLDNESGHVGDEGTTSSRDTSSTNTSEPSTHATNANNSSTTNSSTSSTSTSTAKSLCNKRKRGSDKFQRIEGLVDKLVKLQEKSDERYLKMEEKMLEMEEKRFKEAQELQLRMFSMLCNTCNFNAPSVSHTMTFPPTTYVHPMYAFDQNPNNQDN